MNEHNVVAADLITMAHEQLKSHKHLLCESAIFLDHNQSKLFLWNHSFSLFFNQSIGDSVHEDDQDGTTTILTIQSLMHNDDCDDEWLSIEQLNRLRFFHQMRIQSLKQPSSSSSSSSTIPSNPTFGVDNDDEEDDSDNDWNNWEDDDDDDEDDDHTTSKNKLHKRMTTSKHDNRSSNMNKNDHHCDEMEKALMERRVVYFVTDLSPLVQQAIHKSIFMYDFRSVTVFVTHSPEYLQYYQSNIDSNHMTYSDLESSIQSWMCERYGVSEQEEAFTTIQVNHFPVNFASISNDMFLIPDSSHVFPEIDIGLTPKSPEDHLNRSALGPHSTNDQQYMHMANSLFNVLSAMHLSADLYALGRSSDYIADHLNQLVSQADVQSSSAQKSCLFLIDRTLDLVSPMIHSDNIIDKMIQLTDERGVEFSIGEKFKNKIFNDAVAATIKTNQFIHSNNPQIISTIQTLLNNSSKDVYSVLIGQLTSLIPRADLQTISYTTKPKEKQIQILLDFLLDKHPSIVLQNMEYVQFLSVLNEIINGPNNYSSSTEQVILMEAPQHALVPILELISRGNTSLREIVKLLILSYSYLPMNATDLQEDDIRNNLHQAIVAKTLSIVDSGLFDNTFIELLDRTDTLPKVQKNQNIREVRPVQPNKGNKKPQVTHDDSDEDWGDIPSSDEDEEEEDEDEDDEFSNFDPFAEKKSKKDNKPKQIKKEESEDESEEDDDWNNDWDDNDEHGKTSTNTKVSPSKTSIVQHHSNPDDIVRINHQVHFVIERIFTQLHLLQEQRRSLSTFRHLSVEEIDSTYVALSGYNNKCAALDKETSYEPLLKQFIAQLSDENHNASIPDIKHHKSLLKNLFGRLLFQSKRKLISEDCQSIILFVVGGVTAAEVCDMRKVISYHNQVAGEESPFYGKSVLIGSTNFINSNKIYEQVLIE